MSVFKKTRKVAFQDVDAASIVYFAKILEYCHDAYFELLETSGIDIAKGTKSGPYLLPLVHTEADFKKPLKFGDSFEIKIDRAIPGKSSYTVEYTLCSPVNSEEIFCTAKTKHAVVHRKTFKSFKKIPAEIKTALKM
jgi:1,4-dihydroxy-2-naphthoyl-CoA hydrolase